MYNPAAAEALIDELGGLPPAGQPHGVALPGTERPNRSAVYRHWKTVNRPLVETLDPAVRSLHDLFESAVQQFAKKPCLGSRRWLAETGTWDNAFTWSTFAEIAERRKNFGAGIVELHNRMNYSKQTQYPIALWAPNMPDWQVVGKTVTSSAKYR